MIVLDASALIEVVRGTPLGRAVVGRLAGTDVVYPGLIHVEVASVFRDLVARDLLPLHAARGAVRDAAAFPGQSFPPEPLLDRVLDLREHLTAHEALYVALSEYLGAPLVTVDPRLAEARGHSARVELITA